MNLKGIVLGTAMAGLGAFALNQATSEDIKGYGGAVKELVTDLGKRAADSEIGRELTSRISETKYGPAILNAMDGAGKGLSSGFDKFVGALADSKEAAEAGNGTFLGNVAGKLAGAVSSAANYVAETVQGSAHPAAPGPEPVPAAEPAPAYEEPGGGYEASL